MRIIFTMLVACLIAGSAHAGSKVAFIVGIDKYPSFADEDQLNNAVSDANAFASELRATGQYKEVVALTTSSDTSRDSIAKKWIEFLGRLDQDSDVVIYYAGHAVDIRGRNYIVPSDSPKYSDLEKNEDLAAPHFYLIQEMMERLQEYHVRVQAWFIDACRTNPFIEKTRGDRQNKLAIDPIRGGLFVVYSASAGERARDAPIPSTISDPKRSPFSADVISNFAAYKSSDITQFGLRILDQFKSYAGEDTMQTPQLLIGLESGARFCLAECSKLENKELGKAEEINKVLAEVFGATLSNSYKPTFQNNSIYLGKASAATFCQNDDGEDAYPFGCKLLEHLSATSAPDTQVRPFQKAVMPHVQWVNKRRRLPSMLAGTLLSQDECVVEKVERNKAIKIDFVVEYRTGNDTFFYGVVDGTPKEQCLQR